MQKQLYISTLCKNNYKFISLNYVKKSIFSYLPLAFAGQILSGQVIIPKFSFYRARGYGVDGKSRSAGT